MHKLTLGFSPCPNDCFIFDALVNGKIDTEGLKFEVIMADVEELNKRANPAHPTERVGSPSYQRGDKKQLDITKLSYASYVYSANDYVLLNSGSALGFGVGPIVISKSQIPNPKSIAENGSNCDLQFALSNLKIAIPGKLTTANFLFSLAFPEALNKIELLFSEIEEAVINGKADAGVIIHENRFTYQQKGLKKIIDLGEWWENETCSPIPLGGIAMKRTLPDELKQKADRLIRKSVEFAFANPKSSLDFVKKNAQEMNEEVMYKHIDLYVNRFSIDLGIEGKKAVMLLMDKAMKAGVISSISREIFLEKF